MTYQCLDIIDALPLLENNAKVVDIRDPASFSNGRIRHALHLTNDNIADFIATSDMNTPIIVCCYHGNSSKNAAEYLASVGFKEVYSLNGGFTQWLLEQPERCESN
ncbi:thiosulfate sulfurtransferase GlpE [Marinomonas agarivorans]|nr:thiosulfate sulfurtransferase GlpE [Marinomonas agarivorans]